MCSQSFSFEFLLKFFSWFICNYFLQWKGSDLRAFFWPQNASCVRSRPQGKPEGHGRPRSGGTELLGPRYASVCLGDRANGTNLRAVKPMKKYTHNWDPGPQYTVCKLIYYIYMYIHTTHYISIYIYIYICMYIYIYTHYIYTIYTLSSKTLGVDWDILGW